MALLLPVFCLKRTLDAINRGQNTIMPEPLRTYVFMRKITNNHLASHNEETVMMVI